MHDELDRRVLAALREEADSVPFTLSGDAVARKLSRSTTRLSGAWVAIAAALVIAVTTIAFSTLELGTLFRGSPNAVPVPPDSSWELVTGDIDGESVPIDADYRITARIAAASIGGSTGCNRYGAVIEHPASAGTIAEVAIGDIETTLRGCAASPGDAQRIFLAALRRVNRMELVRDQLVMSGPGVTLRFAPLPGV